MDGEFLPANEGRIKELLEGNIQNTLSAVNSTSYICSFSGNGNFRNDVAKQEPYKGNRDPNSTRPFHYDTVYDYVVSNHPSITVDGMEADDWLGIEQRANPYETVICTRDKDMGTVYGWHYRWACGKYQPERPLHWITPFEAKLFFFQQMLTGDTTDNILGCGVRKEVMWGGKLQLRRKGVGPKEAEDLLKSCETVGDMLNVVTDEYKKIFSDNYGEVMLENARLLYIGQTPNNLFDWSWLNLNLNKDVKDELPANSSDTDTERCGLLPSTVSEQPNTDDDSVELGDESGGDGQLLQTIPS